MAQDFSPKCWRDFRAKFNPLKNVQTNTKGSEFTQCQLIYLISELSNYLWNLDVFVFCVSRLWIDRGQWHPAEQDSRLFLVDRGLWESGASSVWRETPHFLTAVGQGNEKCGNYAFKSKSTHVNKLRLVTSIPNVVPFCLSFCNDTLVFYPSLIKLQLHDCGETGNLSLWNIFQYGPYIPRFFLY